MKCSVCESGVDSLIFLAHPDDVTERMQNNQVCKTQVDIFGHELSVYIQDERHFGRKKYLATIPINYCPWCGRKLGED